MKKKCGCLSLIFMLFASLLLGCGDDLSTLQAMKITGEKIQEVKIVEGNRISTNLDKIQEETREELGSEVTEVSREESTEEENDVISITISAAGDCSLGNHQEQEYYFSFRQAYDQAESPAYFLENVHDIFSQDDFTIVNLEGVLTYSNERVLDRTYNIKGDPEYAQILSMGSVEGVAMGNNHRLDYGTAGTEDTVAALLKENIVYAYDENIGTFETKGIKIGFFSINELAWGYGSEALVREVIAKLREENVDLIIANCHWGIEREYYPEADQRKLARLCIEEGADLVIGHHPHVLQGIESYNGKYIVYSLGNFSFGANRNPADKDTMIFQQTFTFEKGEKIENQEARIIPCSVSSVSTRNDFKPTPVESEEYTRILNKIAKLSSNMGIEIVEDGRINPLE